MLLLSKRPFVCVAVIAQEIDQEATTAAITAAAAATAESAEPAQLDSMVASTPVLGVAESATTTGLITAAAPADAVPSVVVYRDVYCRQSFSEAGNLKR